MLQKISIGFGVLGTHAMAKPKKDNEDPFAFWLVERFLPHDEEPDTRDPMSNFQFFLHLAVATVIIVIVGVLIRSCTI